MSGALPREGLSPPEGSEHPALKHGACRPDRPRQLAQCRALPVRERPGGVLLHQRHGVGRVA
eukprot:1213825-Alexandrium_andersonii.AAC.1